MLILWLNWSFMKMLSSSTNVGTKKQQQKLELKSFLVRSLLGSHRSLTKQWPSVADVVQVGELDPCPLGDELLSLVFREEELVNRNVRASNLLNLRKRIVTKFLQLIRSPDHNPEIIRYEKVFRISCLHLTKSKLRNLEKLCLGKKYSLKTRAN